MKHVETLNKRFCGESICNHQFIIPNNFSEDTRALSPLKLQILQEIYEKRGVESDQICHQEGESKNQSIPLISQDP